ncbi:MAG: TFIIB-type zinc ribbon-containing protein [Candidatus Bathyarchaeia archaeon]
MGRQETDSIDFELFFVSPVTLRFINFLRQRLSWDQQAELAASLGLCLECGGRLKHSNGEVVCGRCGLVWREGDNDERIPFPEFEDASENGHYEVHWNPGSSLSFHKGLGTHIDSQTLIQILSRSEKTKVIMPTRILMLKDRINKQESMQTLKILARVSFLLDKFGMRGNHIVAEYAGRLSRKLCLIARMLGVRLPRSIADAIVVYTLRKYGIKNYETSGLNLKSRDMTFIAWYVTITEKMKKIYAPNSFKI